MIYHRRMDSAKEKRKALPDLLILGARPAGLGSPEYAWSTRTSKKIIQQRDFLKFNLKLLLFIAILKLIMSYSKNWTNGIFFSFFPKLKPGRAILKKVNNDYYCIKIHFF
jgi:hypothetical protein